jgi:hypothetical protein
MERNLATEDVPLKSIRTLATSSDFIHQPPWHEQLCSTMCSSPWCSALSQAPKQWSNWPLFLY